jgi:hypothetical protein
MAKGLSSSSSIPVPGPTVVSQELARELRLPHKGQTLAGRPGASTPVPAIVTRIDQFELGEAQIYGLFAVSLDLSTVLAGSQAPRGVLSAAAFPGACSSPLITRRSVSTYGAESFPLRMVKPFLHGTREIACQPSPSP